MAVKPIGALALLVWAGLTCWDLPHWRSNDALWSSVMATSPTPRAMVNLAVVYRQRHDFQKATDLLVKAGGLAGTSPHPGAITQSVRAQVQWMQAFGGEICSRPDVQPYCY